MKKLLLAIVALSTASFAHAQCTELFFSEIVEGSGNNKAFEVYNPTSSPVSLSNYRIVRYSNGATAGADSLTLSGTLGAHSVWVVVNGQTITAPNSPACDTALQALANQLGNVYPDPCYANGDDAIVLARISPYAIIDIFGKIGEDPGTAWTDVFPYTSAAGAWWTANHTLVRKPAVTTGVTTNPTAFNVTTEWDSLPEDTWTNLGMHVSTCGNTGVFEMENTSSVSVYPNPSNGTFTVNAVSPINKVEIYNVLGEMIFTETVAADKKQVNLSGHPTGIYLVNVLLANGKRSVSKISVQ